MGFPLGDWIDAHEGLPHHLARSGMGATLATVAQAIARPEPPDDARLRSALARLVGVPASRLFLTHGATEANGLALGYLARRRARGGATPRCAVPTPDYPPIARAASLAGFRLVREGARAELVALSDPNNPRGLAWPPSAFDRLVANARDILVDETFREFTDAPSRQRQQRSNLWSSGTFTKVYGGDALRVGYLAVPDSEAEGFGEYHAHLTDRLPPASTSAALAILRDRARILVEVRGRFQRNLAALRASVPAAPRLVAPVWFDRQGGAAHGDRLARRLAREGILVCSGALFGDPRGVRVCLTQRSFPEDLAAYLDRRDADEARRGGITAAASSRSKRGRRRDGPPAAG